MDSSDIEQVNAALRRLSAASTPLEKKAARNAAVQLGLQFSLAMPKAEAKEFCDRHDARIRDAFAS